MIYLSHVDTKRQDMIVQAKFLEQSHKDVGITHPLVILKTDERKKYKKYSVTDVNYAMYNRYISVMEYIKNHSLQKETICVLDCDMFFFKEYIPIEVTNNEVVSQEWYGAERWVNEWKWFLDSDFDHYQKVRHLLGAPLRSVELEDEMMDTLLEYAIDDYSQYVQDWLIESQWTTLNNLNLDTQSLSRAFITCNVFCNLVCNLSYSS